MTFRAHHNTAKPVVEMQLDIEGFDPHTAFTRLQSSKEKKAKQGRDDSLEEEEDFTQYS